LIITILRDEILDVSKSVSSKLPFIVLLLKIILNANFVTENYVSLLPETIFIITKALVEWDETLSGYKGGLKQLSMHYSHTVLIINWNI